MNRSITFPENFLWGAATSAYQIEGATKEDGRGESIWDRFAKIPGKTHNGEDGEPGTDSYHRWREDIALLKELGATAYRFSIAWPRILPNGTGAVNPKGLAWYQQFVDGLLEAGIEPFPTLYHWDLPAALDDRGGWLNPDMPDWFADYAQVCYRALDDRVQKWVTLNEPWVIADGGFMHGALAPGHKSAYEAAIVAHRLMQGHARAVQAYRATGRHEIGLVGHGADRHVLTVLFEASELPNFVEAAQDLGALLGEGEGAHGAGAHGGARAEGKLFEEK